MADLSKTKKEVVRTAKAGDDLELLSEIIKNDPWLMEKVLTKIRVNRGLGAAGALDAMAGKTDSSPKKRGK